MSVIIISCAGRISKKYLFRGATKSNTPRRYKVRASFSSDPDLSNLPVLPPCRKEEQKSNLRISHPQKAPEKEINVVRQAYNRLLAHL